MSFDYSSLIELRDVSCSKEKQSVFKNVNLVIHEGDIVVLRGKSGSGKTTLLKCIAHLILYGGDILYRGSLPTKYGVPFYRTRVLYVPQRPSLLPGSPHDFLLTVFSLDAHKKARGSKPVSFERALDIAKSWGIDVKLWDREWANLSGGEAQRIALAAAIGLGTAEVILLDEPTSALDSESCAAVEKSITDEVHSIDNPLRAVVWITHSDEQGARVGNRFIQISAGGCYEEPIPLV